MSLINPVSDTNKQFFLSIAHTCASSKNREGYRNIAPGIVSVLLIPKLPLCGVRRLDAAFGLGPRPLPPGPTPAPFLSGAMSEAI